MTDATVRSSEIRDLLVAAGVEKNLEPMLDAFLEYEKHNSPKCFDLKDVPGNKLFLLYLSVNLDNTLRKAAEENEHYIEG